MLSPEDRLCGQLPQNWPSPPMNIVLVEPEIPQNTGNIARTCAATGSVLHLVEPLGFRLTDRDMKRAGLDYWESVTLQRHRSLDAFLEHLGESRLWVYSTTGAQSYADVGYQAGDYLLFGSEGHGLPPAFLERFREKVCGIPMQTEHVRSLNLATSVGIVLYEALRGLNRPS